MIGSFRGPGGRRCFTGFFRSCRKKHAETKKKMIVVNRQGIVSMIKV